MAPTTSASKGPIQLRYNGGQVVVTPDDQDRFVMASRQAVSACQNALAVTRLVEQFKSELLGRLHQWCAHHAGQVQSCYVPFLESGSCINAFIVAKSAKFDFALSDAIADLEVALDEAKQRLGKKRAAGAF